MTQTELKQREGRLLCPPGFVATRIRGGMAYVRQDVVPEQLELLLSREGEILKETRKNKVRAVGNWIIKERRSQLLGIAGTPSRNREKHSRPWRAGNYLRMYGINVPEPLAYVERRVAGMVAGSWHIFQNLNHCRDVETYLSEIIITGATGMMLASFLHHLAVAVNELEAVEAYHGDLAGKNIYTPDGERFYFIDLDAVEYGVKCDQKRRMKNHVQLYDSFCDALADSLLVPFLDELLPESEDLRVWMPEIRKAQQQRRAKVEADWAKNGRPEHINPLRAFQAHS